MSEHRFDWYAEAFEPKDGFGIRPGENPVGLTKEENDMYYEAQNEAGSQAVLRIRTSAGHGRQKSANNRHGRGHVPDNC